MEAIRGGVTSWVIHGRSLKVFYVFGNEKQAARPQLVGRCWIRPAARGRRGLRLHPPPALGSLRPRAGGHGRVRLLPCRQPAAQRGPWGAWAPSHPTAGVPGGRWAGAGPGAVVQLRFISAAAGGEGGGLRPASWDGFAGQWGRGDGATWPGSAPHPGCPQPGGLHQPSPPNWSLPTPVHFPNAVRGLGGGSKMSPRRPQLLSNLWGASAGHPLPTPSTGWGPRAAGGSPGGSSAASTVFGGGSMGVLSRGGSRARVGGGASAVSALRISAVCQDFCSLSCREGGSAAAVAGASRFQRPSQPLPPGHPPGRRSSPASSSPD